MRRRILREGKAELELAVTKCLSGAKLTPSELNEVCELGESDLMRDYGCDLYMAETVKLHAKSEMMRLRAQNQYSKMDGLWNDTGYPTKPFTRTEYVKESRTRLAEDHHMHHHDHDYDDHEDDDGRMLDYGEVKSDSHEGRMMKQALRDVAVDAYRLHQMLEDGDDIPQWCHYKMAQAQQMVGSVRNYLEYELERRGEDLVGEKEMFDPEEMEEDFGEDSTEDVLSKFVYDLDDHYDDFDDVDDWDEDDDDDLYDYDVDDEPVEFVDVEEGDPESSHYEVGEAEVEPDEYEGYDGADTRISLDKE